MSLAMTAPKLSEMPTERAIKIVNKQRLLWKYSSLKYVNPLRTGCGLPTENVVNPACLPAKHVVNPACLPPKMLSIPPAYPKNVGSAACLPPKKLAIPPAYLQKCRRLLPACRQKCRRLLPAYLNFLTSQRCESPFPRCSTRLVRKSQRGKRLFATVSTHSLYYSLILPYFLNIIHTNLSSTL